MKAGEGIGEARGLGVGRGPKEAGRGAGGGVGVSMREEASTAWGLGWEAWGAWRLKKMFWGEGLWGWLWGMGVWWEWVKKNK